MYPQIKKTDLFPILKCALIGALVAGIYGIVHDQITFTISPEYFTKLKFKQFHYADFGFGDRVFTAIIGFLATCWVGLFIGYFFGRRFTQNQPRNDAVKNVRKGFLIVLVSGLVFATGGWIYGYVVEPTAYLYGWSNILTSIGVVDGPAFMRVMYIHNASYAGVLVGLICAFIFIKPQTKVKHAT